MEKINRLIALAFGLLCLCGLSAQELNCKVTINSEQIQGTNKTVFETLEKAISDFMNDRQWTDYEYQVSERIECSLYMVVNSYTDNSFSTELQVMSTRPVYNSTYKTPLFSYNDKAVNFSYAENDPMQFDITSFGSNLCEVLAYYAYVIIGMDSESFSKYGGTSCFQKAEQIVNQAQSTNEAGWKAFEDSKNRYALINSIQDELVRPFREYFYTYHRNGLDEMTIAADKSRTRITDGIHVLKDVYKARPSALIISVFAATKMDEIVNIYSKSLPDEKKTAYDIFSYVAPTMKNQLDALKP